MLMCGGTNLVYSTSTARCAPGTGRHVPQTVATRLARSRHPSPHADVSQADVKRKFNIHVATLHGITAQSVIIKEPDVSL